MTFEQLSIGVMVLAAGIMGIKYFLYLSFRNIYTQKILFFNEKFSNSSFEEIVRYRISDLRKFRTSIVGDENYPPQIDNSYMINPEYKQLVDDLVSKRISLKKTIKLTILVFVVIYIILLGIHFGF